MIKITMHWLVALLGIGFLTIAHADALKPTSDGWLAFGGLPQGCNGRVSATVVGPSGELYVGGNFTLCGGTPVQHIARYENGVWSALGAGVGVSGVTGVDDSVEALALSGNTLYVGGSFSRAGGRTAHSIAQWDINTATWAPVNGDSPLGGVTALAVSGTTLYVGGRFSFTYTVANRWGATATNIAQLNINTGTWASLITQGSQVDGVNAGVDALALSGTTLYVGGRFTQAGGQPANHIAQWNISTATWAPLIDQNTQVDGTDGGVPGVYALAVSAGTLYVGGDFTQAGGQTTNHIAQWNSNTNTWAPIVDQNSQVNGVDNGVRALTVSAGTLYVGGWFTQAGGQPANNIAHWNSNTATWAPLVDRNNQVNGTDGSYAVVNALAVSAGRLYAGGSFAQAGGQSANRIASWDPGTSTWFGLGSGNPNGLNSAGGALAISATGFYVGGGFTQAGGGTANHIAQWNSNANTWAPLVDRNSQVDGVDWDVGTVRALAVSAGTLYVGGLFTQAGGQAVNNIAQWNLGNSTWAGLGNGNTNGLNDWGATSFALSGNTLYVGGFFTQAAGQPATGIAQWNPGNSTWTALGSGVGGFNDNNVRALALSGTTLYASGDFNQAGGQIANRVAQWHTGNSIWAALNDGTTNGINDQYVSALAYNSDKDWLAVGGSFLANGATTMPCLTLWSKTGDTWILLQPTDILPGPMLPRRPWGCDVRALAWIDGDLYVGGSNLAASDTDPDNYLVRLSISDTFAVHRSPVGRGVNGPVYALAADASQKRLYVAGDFNQAGGQVSSNIAIAETDVLFRNGFELP